MTTRRIALAAIAIGAFSVGCGPQGLNEDEIDSNQVGKISQASHDAFSLFDIDCSVPQDIKYGGVYDPAGAGVIVYGNWVNCGGSGNDVVKLTASLWPDSHCHSVPFGYRGQITMGTPNGSEYQDMIRC